MSKSVLLKSSIAKKYWMAFTGLFLCLFLVGHLLGNLQLIFKVGEEGKRAFNEYAYFMAHNPFIMIMSYLTYASIIFHVIDGILLTVQNIKARPIKYAHNKPGRNSKFASRNMALLGTGILIFLIMHMANFWWKAKMSNAVFPLHSMTKEVSMPVGQDPQTGQVVERTLSIKYYLNTRGEYKEQMYTEMQSGQQQVVFDIKDKTKFIDPKSELQIGEGYKDLHSLVFAFFGHDKSKEGFPVNDFALLAVFFYALSMLVLAFHLNHGFASAFQSLGLRHPKYTKGIHILGQVFSYLIPFAFGIIPIIIYLTK
jgi:succinate dehydrogenase / fumarate reductase cytochrome b subunit